MEKRTLRILLILGAILVCLAIIGFVISLLNSFFGWFLVIGVILIIIAWFNWGSKNKKEEMKKVLKDEFNKIKEEGSNIINPKAKNKRK